MICEQGRNMPAAMMKKKARNEAIANTYAGNEQVRELQHRQQIEFSWGAMRYQQTWNVTSI